MRIKLDVTNYLVNGQLPADLVFEWTDGLDVKVGRSANEFGQAMTTFHGPISDLRTMVYRYEEDTELADELLEDITDDE